MLNILIPVTATIIHFAIVIAIVVRVVMRRPSVGTALAWLFLVAVLPYLGPLFYLLVGERRIGQYRASRIDEVRTGYQRLASLVNKEGVTNVDWDQHRIEAKEMNRLGEVLVGIPTVIGNSGTMVTEADAILQGIAADVDTAECSVLMVFYIWSDGGLADAVVESLIRAAKRGVNCRILVDAIGGAQWWKGQQPERLRRAGVHVKPALPAGPLQTIFVRTDLRMHRKIVVIDGRVAWTGSMNLVDPRYFKQDAGVGQWVDAMVRVQGNVVALLGAVLIGDWSIETRESAEGLILSTGLHLSESCGTVDAQVIPSGPGETDDGLIQMLLGLVGAARQELVITTPYFVPDESLMRAIRGAAARGVQVNLVLPEKVDSFFVRYASRSYYEDLLDVGVRIWLYRKGLLHTKSALADRCVSMFGTANIDMRSIWLNYEVSLFIYGKEFGEHLYALQKTYIDNSDLLDPEQWSRRPFHVKLLENTARLMSPLL